MAKTKGPLFSLNASGGLGKTISYAQNRGTNYVRSKNTFKKGKLSDSQKQYQYFVQQLGKLFKSNNLLMNVLWHEQLGTLHTYPKLLKANKSDSVIKGNLGASWTEHAVLGKGELIAPIFSGNSGIILNQFIRIEMNDITAYPDYSPTQGLRTFFITRKSVMGTYLTSWTATTAIQNYNAGADPDRAGKAVYVWRFDNITKKSSKPVYIGTFQ